MSIRICGLWVLLVGLLLAPFSAQAQEEASATLTTPETKAFPRLEAYLDVRDARGNFVHGLKTSDVQILENEASLAPLELREQRPGAQMVVVLNPGPPFALRNNQAISRYDLIRESLTTWGKSRIGSNLDDLSLLVSGGPQITHTTNLAEWLTIFDQPPVDARNAIPTLDSLFRAIELAAETTPRPGMGRAVLLVSPPLDEDANTSIENAINQAVEKGVRIYVWIVIGPTNTQAIERLALLAEKTGGQSLTFTGPEPLPSLEDYLEPLRSIYSLAYLSEVKGSGAQQVSALVQTGDGQVRTPARGFDLTILPPAPVFLTPPAVIQRQSPTVGNASSQAEPPLTAFKPDRQELQVLIDFPDGRIRPLVRTSLYIDGALAAQNTEEPFDRFTWNLKDYTATADHTLRVEAEDALGLVGASIDTIIQVSIDRPVPSPWAIFTRNMPVLIGLAVVLAGAVLLLVLLLGGQLRPATLRASRQKPRKADPVTQPVPVRIEPSARHMPNWVNRLQWPQRHTAPTAYAFLSRIADAEQAQGETTPGRERHPTTPIPITTEEVTFGSDPSQATLVLNDGSVEGLHARLVRQEDGSFRISDQGSIAGTWINYSPVSREGAGLEHGDLVHIGRVGFRFTIRQPNRVPRPVVIVEESEP